MSLISWLKGVKAKVGTAFVAVFGKDAAQKFAEGSVGVLRSAAGILAIDAVQWAASQKFGIGEDARKAATDKLKADSQNSGIFMANSMINLLIELALQAVVKNNIILPPTV